MVAVTQRRHASHSFVDVVTKETNEQNHNRWYGSPEDFQWKIPFQGQSISELTRRRRKRTRL